MTDDPAKKKCIIRRDLRRVEEKKEHSKQAFSVTFCGSSSGVYLPPMVIYKVQHYFKGWIAGGPSLAIYDARKSEWFDGRTLVGWYVGFFNCFFQKLLIYLILKVLMGDNLASHFSIHVYGG